MAKKGQKILPKASKQAVTEDKSAPSTFQLTEAETTQAHLLHTQQQLLQERADRSMQQILARMNQVAAKVRERTGIDLDQYRIDFDTGVATRVQKQQGVTGQHVPAPPREEDINSPPQILPGLPHAESTPS